MDIMHGVENDVGWLREAGWQKREQDIDEFLGKQDKADVDPLSCEEARKRQLSRRGARCSFGNEGS